MTGQASHPGGVVMFLVASSGFSVEFSAAVAVLLSPVTFAAKVILLYLYLVNKLILKRSYNHYTYYTVTALVTGVTGYALK